MSKVWRYLEETWWVRLLAALFAAVCSLGSVWLVVGREGWAALSRLEVALPAIAGALALWVVFIELTDRGRGSRTDRKP